MVDLLLVIAVVVGALLIAVGCTVVSKSRSTFFEVPRLSGGKSALWARSQAARWWAGEVRSRAMSRKPP
jgi:hypothetical protein